MPWWSSRYSGFSLWKIRNGSMNSGRSEATEISNAPYASSTAGSTPRYCGRYKFMESVTRRGDHTPEAARPASPGSAHI